jgi:hypothetical protein
LKKTPRKGLLAELRALGTPERLCARLKAFLRARHPGEQNKIYHSLAHTYEVAGLTGAMLHKWPNVPVGRKVLLILAAAMHDVDPERKPGTPARVEATLAHLERDPEARQLLADFAARFDFSPDQVGTLVMATDYSARPAEKKQTLAAFLKAHKVSFVKDPWIPEWGRRLAYWDQIATYLHTTPTEARSRVAGLGRELRRVHAFNGSRPAGGLHGLSHAFLSGLMRDDLFAYLTQGDQIRFAALVRAFEPRAARRSPAA